MSRWRQLFRLDNSAPPRSAPDFSARDRSALDKPGSNQSAPAAAVDTRPAWDILRESVQPPPPIEAYARQPAAPRQDSGKPADPPPEPPFAEPPFADPAFADPAFADPAFAEPPLADPGVAAAADFDERWYVRENQDVAEAIAEGRCPSGLAHYLEHGRNEGRRPGPGSILPRLVLPRLVLPRPVLPQPVSPRPVLSRLDDDPGPAPAAADTVPAEQPLEQMLPRHSGAAYLTPGDLRVSECQIRRVMVIGSCFIQSLRLGHEGGDDWQSDFHLTNNMSRLPDAPPQDFTEYDFQVVQIALRSVLPDAALWHLPHAAPDQYTALFESVRARLLLQLQSLLAWNRNFGIPAFVMNFLVPQANPMGRLLPRYDLRNPAYFIEQLNQELARALAGYEQVYLLDVDAIAASLGRRYVQDDAIGHLSHNSVLPQFGLSGERIEPLLPMAHHYETGWSHVFAQSVRAEIVAMYRTLRQADPVKLVVVDLDDTLWNGVSGERDAVDGQMIEGWPLGIVEALAYLKQRGILLAILSKNDDARIQAQWEQIFRTRLRLADFATRRIDWNPKPQNMQQILAELNLLPRNVVFIDDNPVERAAMQQAFPDMRVLGRYPYYLRRILLWSPETQVATVTDESARRTAMVHAQIEREALRETVTREAFLQSLGVGITLYRVGTEHPKYARALELLNKTNQFNTTGRRWRPEELRAALASGTEMVAFEVEDKFVGYGLVGVVLLAGSRIEQFVMSCRVVGLDVEIAVLALLVAHLRAAGPAPGSAALVSAALVSAALVSATLVSAALVSAALVSAALVETDANLLCRTLFARCGFQAAAEGWSLAADAVLPLPEAITVTANGLEPPAASGVPGLNTAGSGIAEGVG